MHWHAIRQSRNSYETKELAAKAGRPQLDGGDSTANAMQHAPDRPYAYAAGDDACDARDEIREGSGRVISDLTETFQRKDNPVRTARLSDLLGTLQANRGLMLPCGSDATSSRSYTSTGSQLTEDNLRSLNSSFSPRRSVSGLEIPSSHAVVDGRHTASTRTALSYLQVSVPSTAANNLTPFAYHRALQNRIRDDELRLGRKYDIKAYTPVFVHDCLMMPGSLANVRGKGSAEDVVRRMTPALLPGFHARVHTETSEPLLLQSSKGGDYVNGMLVFGQTKEVRHKIHQHYRQTHKRIKVEVELDSVHPIPWQVQRHPSQRWELRRRSVWAYAWIWRNASSRDARFEWKNTEGGRRFDDYVAGELDPPQSLRIEPAGWIEDDGETIATGDEISSSQRSLNDWQAGIEEPSGEWQEGDGEGGAVEFTDEAWNNIPDYEREMAEDEEGCIDRCALDHDYDRSGSASFW